MGGKGGGGGGGGGGGRSGGLKRRLTEQTNSKSCIDLMLEQYMLSNGVNLHCLRF